MSVPLNAKHCGSPETTRPVRLGVVGAGSWGTKLIASFDSLRDVELRWVCDVDPTALANLPGADHARRTESFADLLGDPTLDAVAIAIHAPAQSDAAVRALEAGKHVFVEKPIALSVARAERVVRAAERARCVLMVGLTYRYNALVDAVKHLVDVGSLGRVRRCFAQRSNETPTDQHTNALWSLAPHDVSILIHLFGLPDRACTLGSRPGRWRGQEAAQLRLEWSQGPSAEVFVSLLDPPKTRLLVLEGERGALVLDEMERPELRLRVLPTGSLAWGSVGEPPRVPDGGIPIAVGASDTPLVNECRHFVDCVRERSEPRTGRRAVIDVTRVLEALQHSADAGGSTIELGTGSVRVWP